MSDEPNQDSDHTQGVLLLRRILGRLRLFRVRNLRDAADRGGPFV
jgi:hypothetical protein